MPVAESSDGVAVRALGRMPFMERRELAAVSSLAERTALDALHRLDEVGHVESVRHSLNEKSRLQRWYLTPGGIEAFAEMEGMAVEEAIKLFPLSAEWRRWLLRRMDTVATCYRIALDASLPYDGRLSWRWERSGPLDAFMTLSDGRTLGIARFGPALPRRSMYSRLGSLIEMHRRNTLFAALLVLPGPIEAHGILERMKGELLDLSLAVETDVRHSRPGDALWRSHTYRPDTPFPIEGVIKGVVRRPAAPVAAPPRRAAIPEGLVGNKENDLDLVACNLGQPAGRMLDTLGDWPLMSLTDLAEFLGISVERAKTGRKQLSRLGLVVGLRFGETADERRRNETRLALSSDGLRYLAWRERTRLSDLTAFWGVHPYERGDPALRLVNYRIRGAKLRVLTRELKHTVGVHRAISALASACRRAKEWELLEMLPPHRWERWFHYNNRRYGLKPDAICQLAWRGESVSLLLEYEERAIKPVRMHERLWRYRRYYGALETQTDFECRSMVAVVFPDAAAASRCSAYASRWAQGGRQAGMRMPLLIGSLAGLDAEGALGPCWLMPSKIQMGTVRPESLFRDRKSSRDGRNMWSMIKRAELHVNTLSRE